MEWFYKKKAKQLATGECGSWCCCWWGNWGPIGAVVGGVGGFAVLGIGEIVGGIIDWLF